MESEISLLYSQQPANDLHSEPDQSNLHPSSLGSMLIISSHLPAGLPSGVFVSGSPIKVLYEFFIFSKRATCPVYLIFAHLFILIMEIAIQMKDTVIFMQESLFFNLLTKARMTHGILTSPFTESCLI